MSASARLALRVRQSCCASQPFCRTFGSSSAWLANREEQWPQRTPLGEYYRQVLNNPPPYPFEEKPEEPPTSADPKVQPREKKPHTGDNEPSTPSSAPPATKKKPGRKSKSSATSSSQSSSPKLSATSSAESPPEPSPPPTSAEAKARIIFGSRLAGPIEQAEYLAAKRAQSTYIAGVLVPPKPEEPDNCCMSGCVNCVWDRYREEVEDWAAAKAEAQASLQDSAGSMDADGGGSETNIGVGTTSPIAKNLWDDELLQNLPVGIREFMKQEKLLKEKHEKERTSGG